MSVLNQIKDWSKEDLVRFSVWCARKVVHLNSDSRVEAAIVAAETWLKDPSETNRLAADAARAVARAVAWAADAAAAADATAVAANAAAACVADADAADAAADAAAYAAYAITKETGVEVTDKQLLDSYLDEILLGKAS